VTDEPRRTENRDSWIEIKFICTDRGRHRPYPLLQAMVGPGPDDFDQLTDYTSFRPADRVSIFGGGSTYDEFYCPGCGGRNTRIMHDKFVALLQGLHREGITKFDVSQMNF
jgi:hypothetical protein